MWTEGIPPRPGIKWAMPARTLLWQPRLTGRPAKTAEESCKTGLCGIQYTDLLACQGASRSQQSSSDKYLTARRAPNDGRGLIQISMVSGSDLQPIERPRSLGLQAYRAIRGDLLYGDLRDAPRLTEHALARKYKISRTPVREALQQLVIAGFLEAAAGGYMPRRPTLRDISEIFDLRLVLEPVAVSLAAERISTDEFREIRRVTALGARDVLFGPELTELDLRFHALLAEASGSPTLARVIKAVTERLAAYRAFAEAGQLENFDWMVEHKNIVSALAERDPEKTVAVLIAHLERERDRPTTNPGVASAFGPTAPEVPLEASVTGNIVVQRSLLSHTAYDRLRIAILTGALDSRRPLRESELAKTLAVSRTPVREALRRLEVEGLVHRNGSGRLFVKRLDRAALKDVFSIRELLETYAVSLAVERISNEELDQLDALVAADLEALQRDDIGDLIVLNQRIHDLLLIVSRNRALVDISREVRERVPALQIFAVGSPNDRARFVSDHVQLSHLLRAGNREAAVELARRHVRYARDLFIAGLERRDAPAT